MWQPIYNPFVNQGIFGIGSAPSSVGIFDTSYNPYMYSTPSVISTSMAPINNQLATANSTLNAANQINNAAAGSGAGVAGQATQSFGILPWVQTGLYGLNTLGNLFLGWRSLDLARDQFNFQRDLANQNLAAAIQSYNEAQRARLRGRGFTEEEVDRMMKEQGREIKDIRKYK